jgi:CspA family cold shock protein
LTRHAAFRVAAHLVRSEQPVSNGTIKWFNATKGFGFIQPEDGTSDVFVHISDMQRAGIAELREGDKLTYDVQRGQQGKTSACNLRLD